MEGLQGQLMWLVAKDIEVTETLATVEASTAAPPTPQQSIDAVGDPHDTTKQPAAFDGGQNEMCRLGVHVQSVCKRSQLSRCRLDGTRSSRFRTAGRAPRHQSDRQVNAQLFYVLAVLVKDGVMKKARNALVGHSREIWKLRCEEYEPR